MCLLKIKVPFHFASNEEIPEMLSVHVWNWPKLPPTESLKITHHVKRITEADYFLLLQIRGKDLAGAIKVMPMGLDAAILKRQSGEFKSEVRHELKYFLQIFLQEFSFSFLKLILHVLVYLTQYWCTQFITIVYSL